VAAHGKAVSDGRLSARAESDPSAPAGQSRRTVERPLIATGLTLALFLFLFGLYLLSLHETVASPGETASDLNARDRLYFGIHGFFLVIAATTGFSLGKWINGLGVAFAVLLLASTAAAMVGTQVATYELACSGHNDLVRHWQC